jgi:hypothetical protein
MAFVSHASPASARQSYNNNSSDKYLLRPNRGRSEALGAAKQICCLMALGHFAYVRTAEPYASAVSKQV